MTIYKLTVQRIERDPDYESKYAAWSREHNALRPYYESERNHPPMPVRDIAGAAALECEVSAEEFMQLRNVVFSRWS